MLAALTDVATAVGSSGLAVIVYNMWVSKRAERAQKRAEKRNEEREPLVKEGIQLSNAVKVTELLRQALDELEDAKERSEDDLQEEIDELQAENAELKKEIERLKGSNDH